MLSTLVDQKEKKKKYKITELLFQHTCARFGKGFPTVERGARISSLFT